LLEKFSLDNFICYLGRGWYILEIWGKAEQKNQDEAFGVLER